MKIMDRAGRLSCSLLALLLVQAAYAETVTLSLEDLPKLLRERNQSISGSTLLLEASEKRTGHLARSYLPSVKAVAGGETFQTGTFNSVTQPYGYIEAEFNLFRAGKDALEEQVLRARADAAGAQAKLTSRGTLLKGRRDYWDLVYQAEVVSILKESQIQNEKNLQSATRRSQRGLTTTTDQLDFEIHRDQLREETASVEHETVMTSIRLAALLVMPEDTKFKVAGKIPHEHDESLLATKIDPITYPGVSFLKANTQIASAQGSQNYRAWLPSLDLYAGSYLYTLRDRDYLDRNLRTDNVAGIRLTFHLFDGLESQRQGAAFSLQADAYEQQATQEARDAQARVRVFQEEMKHSHELIHEAEKRMEQGALYLQRTLAEYDRGVKNSPDVLGALQRQIGFRRRSAELRKDYQISKAELLEALGQ